MSKIKMNAEDFSILRNGLALRLGLPAERVEEALWEYVEVAGTGFVRLDTFLDKQGCLPGAC